MCWWLCLVSGPCGFSPWNMSSVSQKCRVIRPRCRGGFTLDVVSPESPALGFTTLQSAEENVCSLQWNVCLCAALACLCVFFPRDFDRQHWWGLCLPGTGESPICPDGDSLLLTPAPSARGNNRKPPPPSVLLTAPTAHYCPSISSL